MVTTRWNTEYNLSKQKWHVLDHKISKRSHIPYFLIKVPPLNSFRSKNSVYQVKNWNNAATIWIGYNFQIQKIIVSAETIWGNTVIFEGVNRRRDKISPNWLSLKDRKKSNFPSKLTSKWLLLPLSISKCSITKVNDRKRACNRKL